MTGRVFYLLALTFAALGIAACDVAPTDPAVQGPAQRAAFAAGASGGAETVTTRAPVRISQIDGGYRGSGPLLEMDSYRPLVWTACTEARCDPLPGSQIAVNECREAGSTMTCIERDGNGDLLGRFTFRGDQRVSLENLQNGDYFAGVWHQTERQRDRARPKFRRMMEAYKSQFEQSYDQVSDQRNAVMDALVAIGTPPSVNTGDTGTDTLIAANRQTTVRNGYNIGNHPIEVQSREVARRYSCQSAQRIPQKAGGACGAFRALVIIEACTPSVVPPGEYNSQQPEYLRVAAGFANEGANLAQACF